MKGCPTAARLWVCFAFGILAAGCAPLTGLSAAGTSTGTCASTLVSLTADSYPSDQLEIDSSTGIAQSFVLQPNESISSVSLKLEAFSSTNPSSLTGSLTISVVQDTSTGSTPSTPNCSPSVGGFGCLESATGSGTLDMSTVSLFQPAYYNIELSSPVSPPSSTAQAFWVVATAAYSSSSTNYLVWDGSSASSNSEFSTVQTQGTTFPSWSSPLSQNMTFQGCQ